MFVLFGNPIGQGEEYCWKVNKHILSCVEIVIDNKIPHYLIVTGEGANKQSALFLLKSKYKFRTDEEIYVMSLILKARWIKIGSMLDLFKSLQSLSHFLPFNPSIQCLDLRLCFKGIAQINTQSLKIIREVNYILKQRFNEYCQLIQNKKFCFFLTLLMLRDLAEKEQKKSWEEIAQKLNQNFNKNIRTGRQCRSKYVNYSRFNGSSSKNNDWSQEEEKLLLKLYIESGSSWSSYVEMFDLKSENCIKNKFYNNLRKACRKIEDHEIVFFKNTRAHLKYEKLCSLIKKWSLQNGSIFNKECDLLSSRLLIVCSKHFITIILIQLNSYKIEIYFKSIKSSFFFITWPILHILLLLVDDLRLFNLLGRLILLDSLQLDLNLLTQSVCLI